MGSGVCLCDFASRKAVQVVVWLEAGQMHLAFYQTPPSTTPYIIGVSGSQTFSSCNVSAVPYTCVSIGFEENFLNVSFRKKIVPIGVSISSIIINDNRTK